MAHWVFSVPNAAISQRAAPYKGTRAGRLLGTAAASPCSHHLPPRAGCPQPEISSSLSSAKCWLLRCSQAGGVYFFRVTYWRPIVFLAFFTRFLESVLEQEKEAGAS